MGHNRTARIACTLLLGILLPLFCGGPGPTRAAEVPGGSDLPFRPDGVISSLNRAIAWYQQARTTMRATSAAGALFTREDQQIVLQVLQHAFDTAHAQAALLAQAKNPPGDAEAGGRQADERGRVQAAIEQEEQNLSRLGARIRQAPARARTALQRETAAGRSRLELDRLRLDFVTKLQQLDSSLEGVDEDLEHRIQALQDALPELHSSAPPESANSPAAGVALGAWAQIHRLLVLQDSRSSLDDLGAATRGLIRDVDGDLQVARAVVRPLLTRLRTLAKDPNTADASPGEGEQQFHRLLEQAKLLGAVVLPLRAESAMLHRYSTALTGSQRAVGQASMQVLRSLGLEVAGVILSIAAVLVGGVLWRSAVVRYVTDTYRRRLLLAARNVVVIAAIVLVVLFHFTTELSALVTALGFAAAGLAFALQTIILAIAGYFSMVAPDGIRVGDRVSLQGPFGYVQGQVVEIGLLRIKLQELAGEPLQPTKRIVIFPNSVVFTGSFFKHPEPRPVGT
jgi:Mechanosensitive ion channel